MLLDKLKLSKPLVKSMTDAGFLAPKEVQLKTMSRIVGGQDVIAVGPEGSGKTTTYVLGILMRLKYGFEEAPRALILVPDKERINEVVERFELLNRNNTIRIVPLYPEGSMETQINAVTDGCDIVIATPDRARAVYLKLGLNLNKVIIFVVDDAAEIIKKGMQLPVAELARSIVKCQHLVFTEVVHDKLHLLIDQFMNLPALIEVSDLGGQKIETWDQIVYHVPDFNTKLNLLNLLLEDAEVFNKVVVFVNTRLTAEKVFKNLFKYLDKQIAIYKPLFFDHPGFDLIDEFRTSEETRVLIVADDLKENIDLSGIPFILHLEIPAEKETFLGRVVKGEGNDQSLAISFSTDIELLMIKKIEQAIGLQIPVAELPGDLIIATETAKSKKKVKEAKSTEAELTGAAFHEKKESNNKDYNYSSREKAKMKFKNR